MIRDETRRCFPRDRRFRFALLRLDFVVFGARALDYPPASFTFVTGMGIGGATAMRYERLSFSHDCESVFRLSAFAASSLALFFTGLRVHVRLLTCLGISAGASAAGDLTLKLELQRHLWRIEVHCVFFLPLDDLHNLLFPLPFQNVFRLWLDRRYVLPSSDRPATPSGHLGPRRPVHPQTVDIPHHPRATLAHPYEPD